MSTPVAKEYIAEEEETVTFYSDDSSDEYDNYKDVILTETTVIKDNNTDSVTIASTPSTLEQNGPLTVDSSSISSDDSTSYFEKPLRTFSEDTVITPPPRSPSMSLKEVPEEEEAVIIIHPATSPISTPPLERKLSHKLSSVSFSDMNDVSLEDLPPSKSSSSSSTTNATEAYNPLKIVTNALMSGTRPNITTVPVPTKPIPTINKPIPTINKPIPTINKPVPPPKDVVYESNVSIVTRRSSDNDSIISTTSTAKSIFALWSPFRSSSSANTSPASSRRPSKQNSAPVLSAPRPSASFVTRQEGLSRSTSIISPLPGFQEALLAQMEQLNCANTNDPKSKVIKNLKRQSIRHCLVAENKGDDYDWDFWAGIMCDYKHLNKINNELIKHIRVGIPASIRGMVWQLLAKSKNEELVIKYTDLLKLPSPYDKMIQRDLARTFPGHVYFKETNGQGQEGLYNVVRAYSLYDDEVGYCQGLAFIVGPMLLNMPDEDAFCVLIKLMKQYGLRGHFTPEMDGLQLRLYQFDALVQEYLPHVARHLNQQGINSTMYASQWFMTLFAYKFPLNLVFRIYDVIFTEGIGSIFKFAIALLKKNQTTILGLDFEHLLDFLKNGLFEQYKDDDRRFVSDACELEFTTKKLYQLEKEYKLLLQKELADATMMEELQKSNSILKKKFETLEQKTNTLKQEQSDVHGQLNQTLSHLSTLKEENTTLVTVVQSLEALVKSVPEEIEAKTKDQFEGYCEENAALIGKNSSLEDQLQKAESILIDIKIRYAQSENDKEELHRRLYELKKLMSF